MTDTPHESAPRGEHIEESNEIADNMLVIARQEAVMAQLDRGLVLLRRDYEAGRATEEEVEKFLETMEVYKAAAQINIDRAQQRIADSVNSKDTRAQRFGNFLRRRFG